MAISTKIEWCSASWNPWMGCKKVSPGCKNCYMFRDMAFYGKDPSVVARSKTTFKAPLRWALSRKLPEGSRIFTCSWSDWFIDKADEWREEAWKIIWATPRYSYLILTKRPERVIDHLPPDWGDGYDNVWLGISAENQKEADKRIPIMLSIPARIRWVSAEPLLGPIDFGGLNNIDWIVTGGESDPVDPRPCNLDWVRSIRDQCQKTHTAYFHKQHGGKAKIGNSWGGRVLDERLWDEFPA